MSDTDLTTTAGRRRRLADLCDRISSAGSKNDLIDAIEDALAVSPPVGDVATLEALAKAYGGQVDDVQRIGKRIDRVARQGLPQAWVGDTSVLASDVIKAAQREVDQLAEAYNGAHKALLRLADAIDGAKKKDGDGRDPLYRARGILGGKDGWFDDLHEDDGEEETRLRARGIAAPGIGLMHDAAVAVDDAARTAARDLNKWASQARAGKLRTKGLTAADKLVLAETDTGATGAGPWDMNEILSAVDMERAGQRMERNPKDRAALDQMLAQCSSPQERAYLMKAYAAGHSIQEIRTFDGKIHSHGTDLDWLQRHLSPVMTQPDGMADEGLNDDGSNRNTDPVTFDGQRWEQGGDGQEGTCVASSTVNARAMADPLYALDLTGGPSGQEDDPAAFRTRLVDEQHRLHLEGDGGMKTFGIFGKDWDGMDTDGQEKIDNSTLSPATGGHYSQHDLGSADDRRAILPDIEKSVDEGRPVPVDVRTSDGKEGHAMMIIGQQGDKLEIYNPWGTTTWVNEDDFINNHMGKASDGDLPTADTVFLPQ